MSDHLQEVSEDESFRQGDIIRRETDKEAVVRFQWGFILNADCDIAQKKNSNLISWMEIISATQFIERYWAVEQLEKLIQKQVGPICDQMNALLKSKDVNLRRLEANELIQWLKDEGATPIIQTVGVEDAKLRSQITAINTALNIKYDGDGFSSLIECAKAFSQKAERIVDAAKSGLENPGGFADYVFVPGIPGSTSEGFVVRLRDISGVPESCVYRSEAEAKINDQPMAFYRVGRFSDGLRYQIVQKMSFLFSRIGSPRTFEEKCRNTAQALMEKKATESVNEAH